MDYEKAYKKALERAKKNYDVAQDLCNGSQIGVECFKNTLTNIFPELGESEDERIRKAIIGTLPKYGYLPQTTIKVEDALTWLEKQGEQPSAIRWYDVSLIPQEMEELLVEWDSEDATWHEIAFYHADTKTFWNGTRQVENVTRWCYIIDLLEKQGNCSAKWHKNSADNKPTLNHSVLMKNIHGIAEGEWNGKEWIQYRWSSNIKDSDVLYWMNLYELDKQGEQKQELSKEDKQ